jgi:prevent-host-death family protein
MNTITVGELRQNPTHMLDEVEHGAVYFVTRHGRQIARIVPVEGEETITPARKSGPSDLPVKLDRQYTLEEVDELVAWVKGDR